MGIFSIFRPRPKITASGWVIVFREGRLTTRGFSSYLSNNYETHKLKKTRHLSLATMFATERDAERVAKALCEKGYERIGVCSVTLTLDD